MHESNTFNRVASTLGDFESRYFLQGGAVREQLRGTNTEVWGFLEAGDEYGWAVEHPLAASASPSGPLAAADWDEIKRLIAAPFDAGARFEAAILVLHGAMVTQSSDDADGELLQRVRSLTGPGVPIVATLDLHANVSARMVESADVLMAYRTYPHVDQYERARHLAAVLRRILDEGLRPRQYLARRPMLDAADHGLSGAGPMADVLRLAAGIEQRPGVLSASVQVGFPWADVAEIGPSAVVSGVGPPDACRGYAEELAEALWETRHRTQLHFARPAQVMAAARQGVPGGPPLILADFADNPAAGAYGDSPNLLRHMLEAGLVDAAFATVADPVAVATGARAGVGQVVELSLGGRHAPELTPPLAVRGEVVHLGAGEFVCEGPMWRGVRFRMGPTMVLRVQGIDVIVSSVPVAVMDVQVFRSVGIDPAGKATLGLKSRNHFRAAYAPIARECVLVDAGGIASMRLAELPYRKIPRPIWPLDAFPP